MKTILSPSTPFKMGSSPLVELGAKYTQDSTGRVWHYAQAGASNLSRGKLAVVATQDAQREDLSFSVAPAIGDKIVNVTIGTGNAAANDYKDGWLVVQDGTGEGRAYPIEGHDAITASTAGKFYLKEAIDTAGALAETGVDLIKNKYDDIVISVTDQADVPVGVPNVAITATYYGWVQTYGACSVLMDEAVVTGLLLTIGSGVAGAVEAQDAAGEPIVGIMGPNAGVDTEYQLVYLTLEN